MGTRSYIVAKLTDGSTKGIYCHWDGYPENNGKLLADHYTDQAKIDQLIGLGDLSSLGEEIGEKHDFDDSGAAAKGCTAYERDRGETGVKARRFALTNARIKQTADSGAEFVYIWDGQAWGITTPERGLPTLPLRAFLNGEGSLEQTVKAFGGGFVLSKRTVSVDPSAA